MTLQKIKHLINPSRHASIYLLSSMALFGGCKTKDITQSEIPSRYIFKSQFTAGESSVSYSGQVMRYALLHAMIQHIEQLPDRLLMGFSPTGGSVLSELELFYDCPDDLCLTESHGVELEQMLKQSLIGDLSSGKNLSEKVAGRDEIGQHRDWSQGVLGWDIPFSPDELVRFWFDLIDAQAVLLAEGGVHVDPLGIPISGPHITPEGLNLAELIEKFLYGALMFSQASDDYLDDDEEGKGLLSDHIEDAGGYTELEHAWDEAFGYLGAARELLAFSAEEITGSGGRPEYQRAFDANEDGVIDLSAEYNWSMIRYAASRDRDGGSQLSTRAFEAFVQGRTLISETQGALSAQQLDELKGYRDEALNAWEGALAASAIHYLNEVLKHLDQGEDEWTFEAHATHWSELKGFALAFQFNPRSALSSEDFESLHQAIGVRPVFPRSEAASAHREALLEARSLLGARYSFSEEQLNSW